MDLGRRALPAAETSTARPSLLGVAVALAVCVAWCFASPWEAFVPHSPAWRAQGTSLLDHSEARAEAHGALHAWPAALGFASCLAVGAAVGAGTVLSAKVARPANVIRRAASLASLQRTTPAKLVEEGKFAGGLIGGESAFKGQSYNFDPMGFSTRQPEFLPWYREAELKHGRVCMLAWVGLVVPDFVRIPGPEEYYGVKNVVEAHNVFVGKNNLGPLFQVFLFVGIIETLTTFAKCTTSDGLTLENAGDYKLGLNFLPKDPEKAKEMRLKELKNGRLAMIAFGGAITQAVLTGNGFPWLYSALAEGKPAPLASSAVLSAGGKACGGTVSSARVAMRAEVDPDQVGAYKMSKAVPFLPVSPALEGYVGEEDGFDPMGFSLAFDMRWLREAELKHARVCMLATVGWITTDLGVRVPGEPFANVSTLEAHNAMIKFGSMQQLVLWIGFAEIFGFLAINKMCEGETDRAPGDFGIRTWYPKDEAGQYEMQLKELRNGRLAMLAFSGIVTVAAFTGKTWPFLA